ncbi:uncharacterized protein LOC116344477 [Contarinia nasturtii]|uniref:uncharacterized protein LOC116344477 n=1 Tax=Contarinia nasturtii TaxID=265458 RepID=UPI0012D3E67A|nr:uncharacterized protein LOC116344477 [Contarinia nasturtii]
MKMSFKSKSSVISKLKKNEATRGFVIRLRDILKCTVQMERISPEQIATASRIGCIQTKQTMYAQQHDHCFSKVSIVSSTEPIESTEDAPNLSIKNSPVQNSPAQIAFDAFENTYSPSVSSLSSISDTDDSTDDNDSPKDGEIPYSTLIKENGADADEVDATKDERITTNGVTIGIKQISTMGDNHTEGYTNGNGMDYDKTPDSLDEFDDEDDDLRFLNGIAEQLDRTDNAEDALTNCDENGEFWPSIRIFGNVCLKHIRSECYGPYCNFSHELPASDYVEEMLKTVSRQEIREAQNQLLLRNEILMDTFFAVFCKFYGCEWQMYRESLRTLISVISLKPLASLYLKEILNGFLISGMVYSTCVEQLLIELDESLNSTEQFELMWELIIDAKNDKIDEQLTEFKSVLFGGALISASAINKIIELQIAGELKSIRDMAVNLVKRSHLLTFQKIDSAKLKQYVRHVRSFDMYASKAIEQRAKQFGMNLDC